MKFFTISLNYSKKEATPPRSALGVGLASFLVNYDYDLDKCYVSSNWVVAIF